MPPPSTTIYVRSVRVQYTEKDPKTKESLRNAITGYKLVRKGETLSDVSFETPKVISGKVVSMTLSDAHADGLLFPCTFTSSCKPLELSIQRLKNDDGADEESVSRKLSSLFDALKNTTAAPDPDDSLGVKYGAVKADFKKLGTLEAEVCIVPPHQRLLHEAENNIEKLERYLHATAKAAQHETKKKRIAQEKLCVALKELVASEKASVKSNYNASKTARLISFLEEKVRPTVRLLTCPQHLHKTSSKLLQLPQLFRATYTELVQSELPPTSLSRIELEAAQKEGRDVALSPDTAEELDEYIRIAMNPVECAALFAAQHGHELKDAIASVPSLIPKEIKSHRSIVTLQSLVKSAVGSTLVTVAEQLPLGTLVVAAAAKLVNGIIAAQEVAASGAKIAERVVILLRVLSDEDLLKMLNEDKLKNDLHRSLALVFLCLEDITDVIEEFNGRKSRIMRWIKAKDALKELEELREDLCAAFNDFHHCVNLRFMSNTTATLHQLMAMSSRTPEAIERKLESIDNSLQKLNDAQQDGGSDSANVVVNGLKADIFSEMQQLFLQQHKDLLDAGERERAKRATEEQKMMLQLKQEVLDAITSVKGPQPAEAATTGEDADTPNLTFDLSSEFQAINDAISGSEKRLVTTIGAKIHGSTHQMVQKVPEAVSAELMRTLELLGADVADQNVSLEAKLRRLTTESYGHVANVLATEKLAAIARAAAAAASSGESSNGGSTRELERHIILEQQAAARNVRSIDLEGMEWSQDALAVLGKGLQTQMNAVEATLKQLREEQKAEKEVVAPEDETDEAPIEQHHEDPCCEEEEEPIIVPTPPAPTPPPTPPPPALNGDAFFERLNTFNGAKFEFMPFSLTLEDKLELGADSSLFKNCFTPVSIEHGDQRETFSDFAGAWNTARETQKKEDGECLVLLEGVAGSGKTTLVKWSALHPQKFVGMNGRPLRAAVVVDLLPLSQRMKDRQKSGLKRVANEWLECLWSMSGMNDIETGEQLVPTSEQESVREILEHFADDVLYLFDGFDEVQHSSVESFKLLLSWLQDRTKLQTHLPSVKNVIITSRPERCQRLILGENRHIELFDQRLFSHLHLQRWTRQQCKEYISNFPLDRLVREKARSALAMRGFRQFDRLPFEVHLMCCAMWHLQLEASADELNQYSHNNNDDPDASDDDDMLATTLMNFQSTVLTQRQAFEVLPPSFDKTHKPSLVFDIVVRKNLEFFFSHLPDAHERDSITQSVRKRLGELACEAVCTTGREATVVLDSQDPAATCGLLELVSQAQTTTTSTSSSTSSPTTKRASSSAQYKFLHKTLMEFLAAEHIVAVGGADAFRRVPLMQSIVLFFVADMLPLHGDTCAPQDSHKMRAACIRDVTVRFRDELSRLDRSGITAEELTKKTCHERSALTQEYAIASVLGFMTHISQPMPGTATPSAKYDYDCTRLCGMKEFIDHLPGSTIAKVPGIRSVTKRPPWMVLMAEPAARLGALYLLQWLHSHGGFGQMLRWAAVEAASCADGGAVLDLLRSNFDVTVSLIDAVRVGNDDVLRLLLEKNDPAVVSSVSVRAALSVAQAARQEVMVTLLNPHI